METVCDLTETDIISVLHKVTIAHLKHTKSTEADAMQVDPSPAQIHDTLSLGEYLGKCVSYDTTASGLRLALRRNLSEVEEAVAILQMLESWMRKWGEAEDTLGVFTASSPSSGDGSTRGLPELSKVRAPNGDIETYLIISAHRWYRSSKRSWTPPSSPSFNTPRLTRSSGPSPTKSSQNLSSLTKPNN